MSIHMSVMCSMDIATFLYSICLQIVPLWPQYTGIKTTTLGKFNSQLILSCLVGDPHRISILRVSIKTIGKAISCSTAKKILLVEILQHRREPGNSVWAPWKYVELNFQARHLWLSRAEHCAQPDHSSKSSPTPPSIYFCCPLCCRMRPLLVHRDFPWQRKMGRDLILCFGLHEELQITFLALFG